MNHMVEKNYKIEVYTLSLCYAHAEYTRGTLLIGQVRWSYADIRWHGLYRTACVLIVHE